eukprot:1147774-Pelagomonas_calceolata.AAC.1
MSFIGTVCTSARMPTQTPPHKMHACNTPSMLTACSCDGEYQLLRASYNGLKVNDAHFRVLRGNMSSNEFLRKAGVTEADSVILGAVNASDGWEPADADALVRAYPRFFRTCRSYLCTPTDRKSVGGSRRKHGNKRACMPAHSSAHVGWVNDSRPAPAPCAMKALCCVCVCVCVCANLPIFARALELSLYKELAQLAHRACARTGLGALHFLGMAFMCARSSHNPKAARLSEAQTIQMF